MSKKKAKKLGNPAAEAERLRRAALNRTQQQPAQVQTPSSESVSSMSNDQGPTISVSEYEALIRASQKIQEQSVDLAADFNRVLLAYAALVTNSFKLSATMSEFDQNDPKSIDRLKSKLAFFIEDLPRNCEKAGIRMPEIAGLDFTPALNVQALNADEYQASESLVIDEVVEPILIYEPKNSSVETNSVGGLLKPGVVTVKRKGE